MGVYGAPDLKTPSSAAVARNAVSINVLQSENQAEFFLHFRQNYLYL